MAMVPPSPTVRPDLPQKLDWTPQLTHVFLPGPSPAPPTNSYISVPCCLCHPSFHAQHCGDISPSRSPLWLFWRDGHPAKVLPWWWHTTCCPGWLQHPPREATLIWIHFFSTCDLTLPPSPLSTPLCHFLFPLEVHRLPRPDTSYGHHLLPPEIPLSLHSLLNSTEQFSLMFPKEASSTLLSFLSSSLDTFCALTSSQHSHPLLWRCSHTTYIEPFHHLFPWPDSLLLSRWHLTRHLAIPHHPDQLQPHLRPYYSCLQGSYSKFTSTETNPRLSWSYSTVSLLLFLSKTLNPTPSYLSQNKLLYANPSDFSTQSNTTSFSLLWLNLASLTLL